MASVTWLNFHLFYLEVSSLPIFVPSLDMTTRATSDLDFIIGFCAYPLWGEAYEMDFEYIERCSSLIEGMNNVDNRNM